MYRLSFLILFVFSSGLAWSQSPHGKAFTMECSTCHTSESWKVNRDSIRFSHDSTSFALRGQHKTVDCRACHSTLIFSEAPANCVNCHQDMHSQSVGNDCARCHTTNSWVVENKLRMHEMVSFPLLGNHASADCIDCHKSSVPLKFERIGTACVNCHQQDYNKKDNLDHVRAGFSTECAQCHQVQAPTWTAKYNHDFFPLKLGHEVDKCNTCHTQGSYSSTSPNCISCHQATYQSTRNPDHSSLSLSADCATCHTTALGWTPAKFPEHDKIYKLEEAHKLIENDCAACHKGIYNGTTPKTCFGCHTTDFNATNNPNHKAAGYPTDCAACHTQTTWQGAIFDHNKTNFPLTGVHTTVNCIQCHAQGYKGISSKCVDCHLQNFKNTIAPSHSGLNISTDCASCHTTAAGWTPAKFPDHNLIYKLEGSHTAIANDCAACHHGVYNGTTPKSCYGCHATNYFSTSNPNHSKSNFSTSCESCHSETAWIPATFDHNKTKFPLTGVHAGVSCIQCHSKGYAGTSTLCVDCHLQNFNSTKSPD